MPGKCFRGLVTLVYVTSSVLPLAAQQGPTQPPLTPVPVQPAPTEPNQAPPGQGQPPPSQLPRRAPATSKDERFATCFASRRSSLRTIRSSFTLR